uniref:Macrophage-expressed gene 1 protein n=1 Tax=Panagrolaimus sp. ES5 TaxID=591445 RepID=A0AC34F7U7_9BILA
MKFFIIFLGFIFAAELVFCGEKRKKIRVDEEKLSDADKCISVMQQQLQHKNMTRTLGGLVGMGWDDMTNEYTLPVFKVTYKECMVDPDNTYLVPDNVLLIPIKKTTLDKTSTVFNSFDEYKTLASNKLTISGSASAKGKGKASASFSRETQDTKESFVKEDSIMIQNKLCYLAFDLIGNEHGGLDSSFIDRVTEIAAAIDQKFHLKAKFLAETLISNYGTHVIHKATAAAEIVQNIFVKKVEEFKGETHMTEIKVGLSAEFDGQAYGGGGEVGVENKQESAKKESTKTDHTKNTINNRGGPHINRVGSSNLTEAMLHVDNLIGINQIGKFLYDIIPAVPLGQFSRMTKYTVKTLVYEAIQDYYKYNSLPGCMEFKSQNYNPLANVNDGSCETPDILFSFGGIYQACSPLKAWANLENVEFGNQCERYERRNRITGGMSCPENTTAILIDSMKIQFLDRSVKQKQRKCWSFFPYCWNEEVDVKVLDEIYTATYWCSGNVTINSTNLGKSAPNPLNKIMRYEILNAIEEDTELLKIFFPLSFNFKKQMEKQSVCEMKPGGDPEKITMESVIEDFIEAGERHFCGGWGSNCGRVLLDLNLDQLKILELYPKTLEALLPILNIDYIRYQFDNHDEIAEYSVEVLETLLFDQQKTLLNVEDEPTAFFGGFFQNNNNNPFTGKPECPSYFEEIDILENLKICICFDTDRKWPIRLGKIFHCFSKEKWCPKGYSEYLAGTVNNCDYKYCIRFHTRDEIMKPVLSKPPYIKFEDALSRKEKNSTTSLPTKNEF